MAVRALDKKHLNDIFEPLAQIQNNFMQMFLIRSWQNCPTNFALVNKKATRAL